MSRFKVGEVVTVRKSPQEAWLRSVFQYHHSGSNDTVGRSFEVREVWPNYLGPGKDGLSVKGHGHIIPAECCWDFDNVLD